MIRRSVWSGLPVKAAILGAFFISGLPLTTLSPALAPASAATVDMTGMDKFSTLRKIMQLVKTEFVKKEVDENKLLLGAIRGLLEGLEDPYTRYMEPTPFSQMQSDQEGEFEGVGIVITVKDRLLTVVSPIDDTPASAVGLQSGDRILKIDGVETSKLTLQEAVNKIRGKKGTPVVLSVWHEEMPEPRDVTMNRDKIPIRTVTSKLVDPKIGYVRISQFVETTATDLERELLKLEGQGIEGLILDLRDNPGGLLQSAVDVSRKFLPKGTVVTVKSREGKTLSLSSYYPSHPVYPLVVLTNKGSASSSEIVSGAIQDNRRGILVGTKTFGKGVIQTVMPMENGAGLILTTAYYFTPSGRSIHEKGVDPDVWTELGPLTAEQRTEIYQNTARRKAAPKSSAGATAEVETDKTKTQASYDLKKYDTQLRVAVEILKGERTLVTAVYDKETKAPESQIRTVAAQGGKIDGDKIDIKPKEH